MFCRNRLPVAYNAQAAAPERWLTFLGDLEHRLLMVDDDTDMNALPKTNYLKSIVTAEAKMDVERKGIQSYQSDIYARFLGFGNGALTSLYDHSDGFWRRQLILGCI